MEDMTLVELEASNLDVLEEEDNPTTVFEAMLLSLLETLLVLLPYLLLLLPLPGLVEEYEGGGVGAQGGGLSEHTHTHTPTVTAAWSVLQRGAAPPHSRQTGGPTIHSPPEVASSTVTPHSQVTQKAPTGP